MENFMDKISLIKNLSTCIFSDQDKCISNTEFEKLASLAESQEEFDFFVELYNYFLKKKSREVIKNGKF